MKNRIHLLVWCAAVAILAFIFLDFWTHRNAPLYRRFETAWADDVNLLEASHKLPAAWFQVKTLEVEGGTPETRKWLHLIRVPLKTHKDGKYKLEVLVVAWEEDGTHGVLLQYNLDDLKTKNDVWELGRTLILLKPKSKNPWRAFLQGFE